MIECAIDFSIIASGSKGNAVVIDHDIMIDCGVPFKALHDAYRDLRLVLLTHIHGDHFNPNTIRKLASERPALRWGVPEWLVADVVGCDVDKRQIDVFRPTQMNVYSDTLSVQMKEIPHNVRNAAWFVHIGDSSMMYATDTNSLDSITAKGYDLYLIEANYCEDEIAERIRTKQAAGQYCHEWDVLQNHLSRQKADDWLYRNMGANSTYVYLHQHDTAERLALK